MSLVSVFHGMGIDESDIGVVASVMARLEQVDAEQTRKIEDPAAQLRDLANAWNNLVEALDGKKEVESLLEQSGRLEHYTADKRMQEIGGNMPG